MIHRHPHTRPSSPYPPSPAYAPASTKLNSAGRTTHLQCDVSRCDTSCNHVEFWTVTMMLTNVLAPVHILAIVSMCGPSAFPKKKRDCIQCENKAHSDEVRRIDPSPFSFPDGTYTRTAMCACAQRSIETASASSSSRRMLFLSQLHPWSHCAKQSVNLVTTHVRDHINKIEGWATQAHLPTSSQTCI